MTRHSPDGFYRIPPDDKGYRGMTELHRNGRTVQAAGVGSKVDAILQSALNKDRSGREGMEVA